MRKISFYTLLMLIASNSFVSCNNSSLKNGDVETDSITSKLRLIDSLQNSGTYYHLESWDIGRIIDNGYKKYESIADRHSVDIYVNKLTVKADTLYYLQLNYWESTSYSERREIKIVDVEELKSFYTAIDDIKKQYGTKTDHYELYLYQSKSEANLYLRHLIKSESWDLRLCSIEISYEDLDELKKLLLQAEKKILQIQNQRQ